MVVSGRSRSFQVRAGRLGGGGGRGHTTRGLLWPDQLISLQVIRLLGRCCACLRRCMHAAAGCGWVHGCAAVAARAAACGARMCAVGGAVEGAVGAG